MRALTVWPFECVYAFVLHISEIPTMMTHIGGMYALSEVYISFTIRCVSLIKTIILAEKRYIKVITFK
mgnify:CR=1 FL=1